MIEASRDCGVFGEQRLSGDDFADLEEDEAGHQVSNDEEPGEGGGVTAQDREHNQGQGSLVKHNSVIWRQT